MILNILTTVIIGLVLGMVLKSLVFLLAYIPLRSYAGGYHSKTQLNCYLFSIVLMTVSLWLIKILSYSASEGIHIIIIMISAAVIYLFSPVEDSNKPLDIKEEKEYKKRTRIILSVLVILACSVKTITSILTVALFVLALMVMLGKIKKV